MNMLRILNIMIAATVGVAIVWAATSLALVAIFGRMLYEPLDE